MKLKYYNYIFMFLLILIIIIICIFSSQNGPSSFSLSERITKVVVKINPKYNDYSLERQNRIFKSMHMYIRMLAHITIYALLFLFLFMSICFMEKKWIVILICYIVCLILSISDEIHQTFISGRIGSYKDVLIDMLGASIMLLIILLNLIIKKRNQAI